MGYVDEKRAEHLGGSLLSGWRRGPGIGLGNGPPTDYQSVEKGSAMTVNWWSVWGLISDIIGVLGVGIIPPDVWAKTVIPNVWVRRHPLREGIVLNPRWQRPMHWGSWGMILLGFLLQLMGQFRR